MLKNDLLKAYFGTSEVIVSGGFNHPTKGHMVEIVGTEEKVPRQSISIWELLYISKEMAMKVFASCFGRTPEQARDIDLKKGALKAPPTNLIKQEEISFSYNGDM